MVGAFFAATPHEDGEGCDSKGCGSSGWSFRCLLAQLLWGPQQQMPCLACRKKTLLWGSLLADACAGLSASCTAVGAFAAAAGGTRVGFRKKKHVIEPASNGSSRRWRREKEFRPLRWATRLQDLYLLHLHVAGLHNILWHTGTLGGTVVCLLTPRHHPQVISWGCRTEYGTRRSRGCCKQRAPVIKFGGCIGIQRSLSPGWYTPGVWYKR